MAKRRKTVARKSSPAPRVLVKYRYKSRKEERKRGRRRGARRTSSGAVAAAVGSAIAGATMGAIANEAGLLMAYPTQNRTGISLVGWVGLGFLSLGLFAKREGTKLLTYGLGGGLVTTELVRQIDMRGYDFDVAFNGAPALTFDPTPPRVLAGSELARAEAFQLAMLNSIQQK